MAVDVRVSDDNPFSESHFKTLKYRPDFPEPSSLTAKAFATGRPARGRWAAEDLETAVPMAPGAGSYLPCRRGAICNRSAGMLVSIVDLKLLALQSQELIRPYLRWCYYQVFPNRRPGYFTDCWHLPAFTPEEAIADALRPVLTAPADRPAVLFLPMVDWHTRIQRSPQLARAFAALGHPCLYVNPHLGCEYMLPYWFERGSWISPLGPGIHELHVHLPTEHVYHRRLLRAGESARLSRVLEGVLGGAQRAGIVQIVSFPIWLDVALAMRDRYGFPIVYDCHDFLPGFDNVSRDILAREHALFESADLIAFSAQLLMDRTLAARPSARAKSVLLRNAVNQSHFTSPAARARDTDRVVGYVGSLDHWFDVAAVDTAARKYPVWKFLLIGRIENERIRRLADLPNIEFAGEVPYSELPDYLARFDVGLIPFLQNELTRGANPIKLYEYFSRGLPVVSTRLPEVERYHELVYLADGPEAFSVALGEAMEEADPARRERRMEIARRESWTARAHELLVALQSRANA